MIIRMLNKIPAGQIGGGIVAAQIASGQVRSGHLGDGAVVTGSVASGQVGSGLLADGAIVSGSFASGQIGGDHVAAIALNETHIDGRAASGQQLTAQTSGNAAAWLGPASGL